MTGLSTSLTLACQGNSAMYIRKKALRIMIYEHVYPQTSATTVPFQMVTKTMMTPFQPGVGEGAVAVGLNFFASHIR